MEWREWGDKDGVVGRQMNGQWSKVMDEQIHELAEKQRDGGDQKQCSVKNQTTQQKKAYAEMQCDNFEE